MDLLMWLFVVFGVIVIRVLDALKLSRTVALVYFGVGLLAFATYAIIVRCKRTA